MPDIFNNAATTLGGTFSADAAQIVFAGGGGAGSDPGIAGGVGLLTQNIQFSYVQQITRLYEVGTLNTFLVAGRTQGQAGFSRVLGPRPVQVAFYGNYGNVCNAPNNNIIITMAAGTCAANGQVGALGQNDAISFLIQNMVLVSIAMTVAAEQMIVNEQLQAVYVSLAIAS